MAAPVSLLRGARAFARDVAREAMPPGYLWDVVDYVPMMINAPLTSRGAWVWTGGPFADGDVESGILAPFTSGEKLLVQDAGGELFEVETSSPYDSLYRGPIPRSIQNPPMLFDQVIWLDGSGAATPNVVKPTGVPVPIAAANCPTAKLGTVWGEFLVLANQPGHEDTVYCAPPDDPTQPWDPNSFWRTSGAVTGIAALRTVILVFHAASIERLRGSRPPAGTNQGDMVLEPLFQQLGTTEPKTIAYWQENVLFADEHGVHITDGAVVRNLVQQGSISSYWRNLYNHKQTISASVFLDFYIVSINRTDGTNDTLVCDLNARQWFRFSNIAAGSMWASGGTVGMERIWAGIIGSSKLARLSSCFFPSQTGLPETDANGNDVLPYFETGYYKLAPEGRKRVKFVYLSYDARSGTLSDVSGADQQWTTGGPAFTCAYILNPQDTTWTQAGDYPLTDRYSRYRLPVGKAPYGIAFQVAQIIPTTVTNISDIAVVAEAIDRGRV